jgi:hypothetical protein
MVIRRRRSKSKTRPSTGHTEEEEQVKITYFLMGKLRRRTTEARPRDDASMSVCRVLTLALLV